MMTRFRDRFVPRLAKVSLLERARSACGALLGLLCTGLLARAAVGSGAEWPILIAPMGASAVLLFAVPASPLAQPWSILGGNVVAALVGVAAASHIGDVMLAGAVAVSVAIALMMLLGCLHPPSGAVALTAVLGGPAIRDLGYGFVLWPVGANSLLLLICALLFNNLTGRSYPHAAPAADRGAAGPGAATGSGLTAADIDAALAQFDAVLDIDPGDLQAILRRAQVHASLRQSGETTCGALVRRSTRALAPDTPLKEALATLRHHRTTVVPVTDESARVLGVVTQQDLIDKTVGWERRAPRLGLGRRIALAARRGRAPHGTVADVMTTGAVTLQPDTAAGQAAWLMMQAGLPQAPVIGSDGRLIGLVDQMDLVGAMLADIANDHPAHAAPEPRLMGLRAG
jgi:CBS domain-containing membrane protein